jgi:hypothetical protein
MDDVNLKLVRSAAITGRILDEFGDPITNVTVQSMRYQFTQNGRQLRPTGHGGQTNDLGDFRIYGLSPGQYYVSATLRDFSVNVVTSDRTGYAATYYPGTGNVAEARRVTVESGQTVTSINMGLLPIRTARVSGTIITEQGRPVSATMVSVSPRVGAGGFAGFQTKDDGTFTIGGLTPGDYVLRAQMGSQSAAIALVTVDGSDVSGIQLVETKPSTLRGHIVFQDGGTPPKASSIHVTAMRQDPTLGGGGNVTVKDDLSFEMTLAAGRVFVRSPPTGPNWRLNRVLLHGDDVTDTGIDVPSNGSMDVVVELTDHLYPISGRVTDANGGLVRDCYVIVFAQDSAGWTPGTRYLASVRPGLDDLYHAKMPTGDYYAVAITDVDQGAWNDPEFLAAVRDRATRFSVAAGDTRVDLPLSPAPVF